MMKSSVIKKQHGAVLAFCLVMLLLLTIAGTRMIQQNKQQLEMANSSRLLTQEFANAEGLLAEAKNVINDHPVHDNYFEDDANTVPNSYFADNEKEPINSSAHQCTPTLSPFAVPYKQNILLAGTELFKNHPILKTTVNGLPRVTILEVRCRSDSGIEEICSSYDDNAVTCRPKSGNESCAGTTIDDITISKFNSAADLCYQTYTPSGEISEEYMLAGGRNLKCPKEIYRLQVISTDSYGTTRQIISDHVVSCI